MNEPFARTDRERDIRIERQSGKHRLQSGGCIALTKEGRAGVGLHAMRPTATEEDCRCALGQGGAGETPFVVGFAKNPVALLGAHDDAMIDVAGGEQLRAEMQRVQTRRQPSPTSV